MDVLDCVQKMAAFDPPLNRSHLLLMSLRGLTSPQMVAFLNGETEIAARGNVPAKQRSDYLVAHPEDTPDFERWKRWEEKGFWALTILDDAYPARLREIEPIPFVLYGCGDPSVLMGFSLAVVGTRHPSAYGVSCTNLFAEGLAMQGATIVSGLAYGIDSLAHRSALRVGRPTVAVLANGLDRIYPAANRSLAEEILKDGCLLSEYPTGVLPLPHHFIARNRLISGLSEGVLVIEAKRRSGTMITVNWACEQGKNVFCVPGNISQPRSEGTNAQIQRGAYLVTGIDDILQAYDLKPRTFEEAKKARETLTAMEGALYDILRQAPSGADELARAFPLGVSDLWMCLTSLEMKGKITRRSDGKFETR